MSDTSHAECKPGTPGEQHELLKPFEGTWKSEVTMWMGPGEPMQSTGTMVNTMDLGGRYLRHDYTGDQVDGPFPSFEGRGFWGYNDATNQFEGFWVDNASNQMSMEYGDYSPGTKSWTMRGEMAMPDGTKFAKRSVVTLINDNEHTMEMFMTGPDGNEHKGMHIHYSRA